MDYIMYNETLWCPICGNIMKTSNPSECIKNHLVHSSDIIKDDHEAFKIRFLKHTASNGERIESLINQLKNPVICPEDYIYETD
jgi:hypothetical protein